MLVFETAREVIGRLDGRPPQTIDRTDVVVAAELNDNELLLIASGGRPRMSRK
jgi:hypothetical protein